MWLTNLKIAILEKNTQELSELLDDIPKLETKEEMEQAVYLLREASELLHTLKDATGSSMIKIKKSLSFLRSTEATPIQRLDIKS